jgi:ABC-type transport system substrate-binding protein
MRRLLYRLAAAASLAGLFLPAGYASTRPRYGGSVRVLLHDRVNSLDPAADEDHPYTRNRIDSLVFETLTKLDAQGRVHPCLANSWSSDSTKRLWQFHIRIADFQDGSPVTAAEIAAAIQKNAPGWKVTAPDRQNVKIETGSPVIHLPEVLADSHFLISKASANGLTGTGPYSVKEFQPGERVVLSANESYWGGRPYPDSIEFQMGATLREQLLERQLGPYTAAELTLDQLRGLDSGNQNISISRPSDLLVLVFLQPDSGGNGKSGRKPVDPRVREALARAVNRTAISNFLLQKKGTPASGLLPQWLTGYEFLLPGSMDLERARELRADAASMVIISPIALAYDFSDPLAKLVAERIALDAREAGIVVQPYGESHVNSSQARASLHADAVLLRIPIASLEPSVALASALQHLGFSAETPSAALSASNPEDLFEVERKTLLDFRVLPIAHIPQVLWLNNAAHNWQEMPAGSWTLDQLWVEGAR